MNLIRSKEELEIFFSLATAPTAEQIEPSEPCANISHVCNQSVTVNNQVTAEQCEENEALSFEHSSLILESNPVDVGTVIKKFFAGEPVLTVKRGLV